MIDWDLYSNFTFDEFACLCGCGEALMKPAFITDLQCMRTDLGFGFTITSGYRCDAYNKKIGGGVAHPTGEAADIQVSGENAYRLIHMASNMMTGIGIKQHGNMNKRFVHLDQLSIKEAPRPRIWTYG